MKRLLVILLLIPALAFGHGMPPPTVITPPPVASAPAPASPQAASAGTSATAWWVFGFLGVGFVLAIYTHMECVREKRGCYVHEP